MRSRLYSVTTSGSAGSASATSDVTEVISGKIVAVHVKQSAAGPSTQDFALKTKGGNGIARTILAFTDTADPSGMYYPRETAQTTAGVNLTFDGTHTIPTCIPVDDGLEVTVAQSNSGKTVDVVVYYEED